MEGEPLKCIQQKLRVQVGLVPRLKNQNDTHSQPFNFMLSLRAGIPLRANLEAAINGLRDLPYIDELRSNEEFADKEAILLMDNCSIHVQAETLQTLADHRVKVITFPPHTTHMFQCLDLSLFGNFKKK
jgi:hypothetical protein